MSEKPLPIPVGIDDRSLYDIPLIITNLPPGDYPLPLFLTAQPTPAPELPELPATTQKHGRHNQLSHGNWAHGANAEERQLARLFHRPIAGWYFQEGKIPHEDLEAAGLKYTYWSDKRIMGDEPPGAVISPNRKIAYSKEPIPIETLLKQNLHPTGKAAGQAMIEYYRKKFSLDQDAPMSFTNGAKGNDLRGVWIHPTVKYPDAPIQVTYFDLDGFSGDTGFKSWVEAVSDTVLNGYRWIMPPNSFDDFVLKDRFTNGIINTTEMQKKWEEEHRKWMEEHKEFGQPGARQRAARLLAFREKHLPGQHDQSEHGNWAHGAAYRQARPVVGENQMSLFATIGQAPAVNVGGPAGTKISDRLSLQDLPKTRGEARRLENQLAYESVADAIQTIDAVNGDGPLPNIPVNISRQPRTAGFYNYMRNKDTNHYYNFNIAIRPDGENVRMNLAHEVGHFIDHKGMVDNKFLSDLMESGRKPAEVSEEIYAAGKKLSQAIQSSKTVGVLKRLQYTRSAMGVNQFGEKLSFKPDTNYVKYLLRPHEMFARAYAQYVATRSGNPNFLVELKRDQYRLINLPRDYITPKGLNLSAGYPQSWDDQDFAPIAEAMDRYFEVLGWRK